MEYAAEQIEDVILVRIKGRIDHRTAKEFENSLKPHLDRCIEGKCRKILLDLDGVDFMTSAGLRVLMIAAKTCDRQKGQIVVAALQPGIQEIFKISRFDLVIKVFSTVQTALEHLSLQASDPYQQP